MDSYLDARIAKLEEHVNWLYRQAGHTPPYSVAAAGAARVAKETEAAQNAAMRPKRMNSVLECV